MNRLVPEVEALLFAVAGPVTAKALATSLENATPAEVAKALDLLRARCARSDRGLELVEVAGGWQLRTDPRFATSVLSLLGGTPAKLSRAALEVLAVVAYRQPVTRAEIEALRGVNSGGVVRGLLERGMVRVAGRRDDPGRPLEYATTRHFLEVFSLPDLGALPSLKEREDLEEG
ncbi:MAG: SMC-Scp complex subunit ScpB [Deltaproteobacteria bacterium]|nr:SMC-Scp complex subunit ScpB [Deltaproteobacteria bacterium]